jgi:hypothetical protein
VCNDQISKIVDLICGRLNTQNRITLGMMAKFGNIALTLSCLMSKGIGLCDFTGLQRDEVLFHIAMNLSKMEPGLSGNLLVSEYFSGLVNIKYNK